MAVETEELAKLRGHRWQVSCLEFRSDGHWLATGGWDREIHVWDMDNFQVYCTLKGAHGVPVTGLSWGRPVGELLCSCSADHTAVLWDVETGESLRTLGIHSGWVLDASFSSSSSVLATASWDKTVAIWDPHTGDCISRYADHTAGVWSVDFHPRSSKLLLSAGEDGSVKLWDLREGKVTRNLVSGHREPMCCVRWSPDGNMVASGSADTKVYLWDINTGTLANTIYGHTDTVKSLAFNPSSDAAVPILASAGDYTILLSDTRPTQKAEVLSLSPHNLGKEVEVVGISPDGSLLVSGGRDGLLVFMNLSVPSLRPTLQRQDSVSSKLRDSLSILDQTISTEDLASTSEGELSAGMSQEDILLEIGGKKQRAVIKQLSTTKTTDHASTSEGELSAGVSQEDILLEIGGKKLHKQRAVVKQLSTTKTNNPPPTGEKESVAPKKEISARVSRQRRTEKKVVDLPTMIAHLSASVRKEEQLSSSESEEDVASEEQESQRKIISNLIHVAQKVSQFSQVAKKPSSQELLKAPQLAPLLPENVIEEKRKVFEGAMDTDGHVEDAYEDYDGYSSLLPYEYDSDTSLEGSGHYDLGSGDYREDITALITSREHSFEVGSGEEYGDDVPFSMI